MKALKAMALALVLVSLGAHAIPPAAPNLMLTRIKTSSAKNCTTADGAITISDLKDTDSVKFVLQISKEEKKGILTVVEDGVEVEHFDVVCK